ncbi:MAG: energy-coupled thiamine transporter ThiT [Christensenellales bacterium]
MFSKFASSSAARRHCRCCWSSWCSVSGQSFGRRVCWPMALCALHSQVLSFITLQCLKVVPSPWQACCRCSFSPLPTNGPGMLVGALPFVRLFRAVCVSFVLGYCLIIIGFAMLGLAGLSNKFSDQWGMIPGIILGTFGRFVCAFLSGLIFFGMYAPEGQNVVIYSMMYNGLYLVPEAIICILLAMIPQIRQLAKRLALQD